MFIKTVSELAYGEAVGDFDSAIMDLIAAVQLHQKAGSFTLTLKFLPQGPGSAQVLIEDGYEAVQRIAREALEMAAMEIEQGTGLAVLYGSTSA